MVIAFCPPSSASSRASQLLPVAEAEWLRGHDLVEFVLPGKNEGKLRKNWGKLRKTGKKLGKNLEKLGTSLGTLGKELGRSWKSLFLASKNAGFLCHFRGVPAVSTQKKIDWADGSSIRMVSIWHHQSSCVIVAHDISLGPSIWSTLHNLFPLAISHMESTAHLVQWFTKLKMVISCYFTLRKMVVITSTRGYPCQGSVHFRHSSLGEDGGHEAEKIFGCRSSKKPDSFSQRSSPPLPESCCGFDVCHAQDSTGWGCSTKFMN